LDPSRVAAPSIELAEGSGCPMTNNRVIVSLVLPAYNEARVLEENVGTIMAYLETLESRYRFEVLLVNDGSKDATGRIADGLAQKYSNLRVIHHPSNFGLGQAFKTAFAESRGDYVVTLDVDLSYSPDHIALLLDKMRESSAKLVLASPYMDGGRTTRVPWLRKTLSVWGNRFLKILARGRVSTITCMVRAYDGPFIRSLVLRSKGMEIMPEVVYKSMVLQAKIVQIPAHLDWTKQVAAGPPKRTSSMRIASHIMATVVSGFVFRPFIFLVFPGLLLLLFSLYVNVWMVIHFFQSLARLAPDVLTREGPSAALADAYARYPHTFIIGLLSLMLAFQLIGMGMLALQSKKYFEEVFYLGTALNRKGGSDLQLR
jgi:glycosyltransferase involved in cell wall biosynthesis